MATILVVEDDLAIRRGVVVGLKALGHTVLEAATVAEGHDRAIHGNCDVVLLDVQLPDGSGFDLLQDIRSAQPRLPIIMVTARGTEEDRVRGLDDGADDYVVKPFNLTELRARIDAVLRRSAERPMPCSVLQLPTCHINLEQQCVVNSDGSSKQLTERETHILHYLAAHHQRIISREELLDRIWGVGGAIGNSRSVDMQMVRLREKIGDADGTAIVTIRGQGYRWQQSKHLTSEAP